MPELTLRLVAAAALVLALAGCGSPPAPAPGELVQEYLNSTDVINDEVRGTGSGADRIANFAAYFERSQINGFLFSAYRCEEAPPSQSFGNFLGQLGCPPSGVVAAAAATVAGSSGALHERNILIKHQSGRLELMPLYVATGAAGATALIDTAGRTYPGGLDDFRAHNDLLAADDLVVVPAAVTATGGGGMLIVVTGHTPGPPVGLVIVLVVVVVAGAVVVIVRRRRAAP